MISHFYSPFIRRFMSLLMISLMVFQLTGCTYYRVKKRPPEALMKIENIGTVKKYFYVHIADQIYALDGISVDSVSISGNLSVPKRPILYPTRASKRIKKRNKDILYEIHIYVRGRAEYEANCTIPYKDIQEIRIIDKDTLKSIGYFVYATAGVFAAIEVLVTIFSFSVKGSCPYIYAYDGEKYQFIGETFGGAIGQNLQRDDYMQLPEIQKLNGEYHLRVTNELKERQYTDLSTLMVVDHNPEQQVMLDPLGKPHVVSGQREPSHASSLGGKDILPSVQKMDDERFYFNDESHADNGIIMKFDKTKDASNSKLILNGKNTLFFDYMFGEFLKKFGISYDHWMDYQFAMPTEERKQKVIDLQFPLSIYVKKDGEWQLVDRINTVGPLADRKFCIPIDLSGVTSDEVEVKIESGFMFWEMDYAAMDFSQDEELVMHEIAPVNAFGTGAKDWTSALSAIDGQYMSQENIGEVAEIIYSPQAPAPGKMQSVFLHSSGYYELIRSFDGKPQIIELNKFKEKGHFSEYVMEEYHKRIDAQVRLSEAFEIKERE